MTLIRAIALAGISLLLAGTATARDKQPTKQQAAAGKICTDKYNQCLKLGRAIGAGNSNLCLIKYDACLTGVYKR